MASSLAHAGRAAKRGSAPPDRKVQLPRAGNPPAPKPLQDDAVITLCSGPVFAIAAADAAAGFRRSTRVACRELSGNEVGWQGDNRTQPPDDLRGTVEVVECAARKLKMRVCRTASLPPSLTGFSCQPLRAGDPHIGIVQRYPMLHIESVAGWRLKLALDYVRRDAKSGSVDEHRDCRCAF